MATIKNSRFEMILVQFNNTENIPKIVEILQEIANNVDEQDFVKLHEKYKKNPSKVKGYLKKLPMALKFI